MTATAREGAREAVLIVAAVEDIESTAAAIAARLGLTVDLVSTRTQALRLLERRTYAAVVLDQMLADADAPGAELLWKYAGLAIPLQLHFGLAGSARLEHEIRAALGRRQREQQLARMAAAAQVDSDLKNAVTGLLLEAQLALGEKDLPPPLERRLRTLAGIAGHLQERLTGAGSGATTLVALPSAER
jgi:signal transduction histidine kinase